MSASVAAVAEYQCNLSSELLKKAHDELNEKPEWRLRDIQALRDMVIAHPGLNAPTDDLFLLRFLRARKFDYDRAYQLLLNYYQIRAENETIFNNLKPSCIQHMLAAHITVALPRKDKFGRRIVYFRPGRWDPTLFPIWDVLRLNLITFEKIIQDEETQICGVVFVADVGEITMTHAKHIDRNYAKLMASVIQEALPLRLQGLHLFNDPFVFAYILSLIRPFLSEKIKDRIQFHGSNLSSLHEAVPVECLPKEVGGTLPSIEDIAEEWNVELLSSEGMFEEMQQYKLDLPNQISKKKNEEIVDCLIGSYKKLNVD